jgi:hypothetical protein
VAELVPIWWIGAMRMISTSRMRSSGRRSRLTVQCPFSLDQLLDDRRADLELTLARVAG